MSTTIKQKVFNEKSIELLPAYFILAEANIGMGGAKLKKAEEFLIAANWRISLSMGRGWPQACHARKPLPFAASASS